MRKAFTLIELVVAVALLAMMISFASLIFDMSIDTHRTAMASAEIMQKLQAITGQLNADFKGHVWNPRGSIFFGTEESEIDGGLVIVRSDCIVFFTKGDFQSTEQCPYVKSGGGEGLKTVSGNVASIFYGLADANATDPREKVLIRRQTILTSDSSLNDTFGLDDRREYCNKDNESSLSELIAEDFDANALMDRPSINPTSEDDLVMYMAKGVDDFTIQYVGWEENPPKIKEFNQWRPENEDVNSWPEQLYPLALKFTFTLYDSKGIFENGRRFTHIVYLGD